MCNLKEAKLNKKENNEKVIIISDKIFTKEDLEGKTNKLPGKKKAGKEFHYGKDYSKKLKKDVDKTRIIDRENDKYHEKVVDTDTGEVIHECHENLSSHTGHGSTKKRKTM